MPEAEVDETEATFEDLDPQTPGVRALRDKFTKQRASLSEAREQIEAQNRTIALYEAGLGDLGPTKIKALLAAHDGELTADGLKGTAAALGFVEEQVVTDPAVAEAAAGQERAAASHDGAGQSQQNSTLTGAAVGDWPIDKQLRFMESHPEEWEILKRGGTVTGIAFN